MAIDIEEAFFIVWFSGGWDLNVSFIHFVSTNLANLSTWLLLCNQATHTGYIQHGKTHFMDVMIIFPLE